MNECRCVKNLMKKSRFLREKTGCTNNFCLETNVLSEDMLRTIKRTIKRTKEHQFIYMFVCMANCGGK